MDQSNVVKLACISNQGYGGGWEKTRVPGVNHRPAASQWQTLSHNVVYNPPEWDLNSQL